MARGEDSADSPGAMRTGEQDVDEVGRCSNCGAPLSGNFCGNCGQSARTFRLSLWRLLRDFLVETFELDGKLARTMGELFVRPGRLPQAFSDNRRASFVSPVRMYLFSSLLFFFLLAFTGTGDQFSLTSEDGLDVELQANDEAAETGPLAERAGLQTPEAGPEEQLRADPQAMLPYLSERETLRLKALLDPPYRELNHDVIRSLAQILEEARTRGEQPGWLLRQSIGNVVAILDDVTGYIESIVENLPLAMFVLLPFYALLLKLMFFSSRRYYAEHLVFALYLHVVAFLVFSTSIVLPAVETEPWATIKPVYRLAALAYLGIYTYLSMYRYYGRNDGSTAGGSSAWSIGWRFIALGACYLLLLVPALLLVMAFSFIGL